MQERCRSTLAHRRASEPSCARRARRRSHARERNAVLIARVSNSQTSRAALDPCASTRPATPWRGQLVAMILRSRSSDANPRDAPTLVETRGRVAADTAHRRTPARVMKMHSESPSVSAVDVPSASPYQQRSSAPARAPRRVPPARHREPPLASPPASSTRGADYVTIPVAAAMTGYSPKAIRRKIEAGVWLEGREFRRAPDGHVLISVKGYEQWVERGRA